MGHECLILLEIFTLLYLSKEVRKHKDTNDFRDVYCGERVQSLKLMHGRVGLAASYNDATGSYNVQLPDGSVLALQPKNLEPVSVRAGVRAGVSGGVRGGVLPAYDV